MQRKTFVYIIGSNIDEVSPYPNCYVGVTKNPRTRWSHHSNSPYTVGEAIRWEKLSFDENFKIIFSGTEKQCFKLERTLRPKNNLGLNEAAGGKGGWKGKYNRSGSNNPKARKWKITDSTGLVYEIHGTLGKFCREHKLLETAMYNSMGSVVKPSKLLNGRGGFRAKSAEHQRLRDNTTGWMLERNIKS